MKRLLLMVIALVAIMSAAGCVYSTATWNAKTGKMYVTRNDAILFGILRQVYECQPAGTSLNCQQMPDKP